LKNRRPFPEKEDRKRDCDEDVDLEDEGREACVHGTEEETEASDEHKPSVENQHPEGVFGGLVASDAGNAAQKKHSAVAKSGRKSRKITSIAT